MKRLVSFFCLAVFLIIPAAAVAEKSNAELAKDLSNPVAALISVPFQGNWDRGIGPKDDGSRLTVNIQPVLPFSVNHRLNIISRTILPLVYQTDIFPGAGDQSGLGDVLQSLFLSPAKPEEGWIWGAGPVFLLPAGTDDFLSGRKWGAGPTGVGLKQSGPWTYGMLMNHLWSFAGDSGRPEVNATYFQPFVSYTTRTAWTCSLDTESSYDWHARQWSAPLIASVSKLLKIGRRHLSLSGGLRYWLESPESGPEGLGLRFGVTFLFPK
ncbi:MAG: transporter [Thermodesulfobacteriota bacterium]